MHASTEVVRAEMQRTTEAFAHLREQDPEALRQALASYVSMAHVRATDHSLLPHADDETPAPAHAASR